MITLQNKPLIIKNRSKVFDEEYEGDFDLDENIYCRVSCVFENLNLELIIVNLEIGGNLIIEELGHFGEGDLYLDNFSFASKAEEDHFLCKDLFEKYLENN